MRTILLMKIIRFNGYIVWMYGVGETWAVVKNCRRAQGALETGFYFRWRVFSTQLVPQPRKKRRSVTFAKLLPRVCVWWKALYTLLILHSASHMDREHVSYEKVADPIKKTSPQLKWFPSFSATSERTTQKCSSTDWVHFNSYSVKYCNTYCFSALIRNDINSNHTERNEYLFYRIWVWNQEF